MNKIAVMRVFDGNIKKEGTLTKEQWESGNTTLLISRADGYGFISKRTDLVVINEGFANKEEAKHDQFQNPSIMVRNYVNGNVGYVDKVDWKSKSKFIIFREKIDKFTPSQYEQHIQLTKDRHAYIVQKEYLEEVKDV
jgi:hypothetical protein